MEPSTMTTGNGHLPGLCLTCDNMASCVHRAHRGYHAICCELFQIAQTSSQEQEVHDAYAAYGQDLATGPRPKGLCFDCENREDCSLSTAEGGVWECADYR